MSCARAVSLLVVALSIGCGGGGGGTTPPPPPDPCAGGACASGTVGSTGGAVTATTGAAVKVPPGALDDATTVGIAATSSTPPAGAGAVGPLYRLTPDGMVFASPVTVTLPLPAGVTAASIYWERPDRSGYDAVGGVVDLVHRTISVEVAHFSGAFVGQAVATRLVTGTALTTYISASSRVSEPTPAFVAPEALVPDGAGGFTRYPGTTGTGPAAGTFTIPGVPVGEYLLHVDGAWAVTSSSSPNLSVRRGGRPPSQLTVLTQATPLTLDVTNMSAWQPTDELEVFGSETNHWDFGSNLSATTPLVGGETSTRLGLNLSSMSCTLTPYAIRGSAGHRLYVAQLVSATSAGGAPYRAMARLRQLAPFDTTDGVAVTATAALVDYAQSNTVAFDARFSAYKAAFDADGGPASAVQRQGDGGAIGVLAQPGQTEDGFYSCNADLLLLSDETGSDLSTGAMSFGSPASTPLSGSWGIIGLVGWSERTTLLFPGAANPIRPPSSIQWVTTLEALQAGPLTPKLTQVRNPTVAGQPFFAGGSGVGLTPELAWSPPATGAADSYTIFVSELGGSVGAGSSNLPVQGIRGGLSTPNTTVSIPPGVLTAGHLYFFTVTARGRAGIAAGLDSATASIVSGVFTP